MSGLGRRQCQRIVNKKCKCFLVVAFLNELILSKNVVAPTQLVNLDLHLIGEESQVQPGSRHDFHARLKKEHQSMDEQLSLSKQQLYHAQDMLLLVS